MNKGHLTSDQIITISLASLPKVVALSEKVDDDDDDDDDGDDNYDDDDDGDDDDDDDDDDDGDDDDDDDDDYEGRWSLMVYSPQWLMVLNC